MIGVPLLAVGLADQFGGLILPGIGLLTLIGGAALVGIALIRILKALSMPSEQTAGETIITDPVELANKFYHAALQASTDTTEALDRVVNMLEIFPLEVPSNISDQ